MRHLSQLPRTRILYLFLIKRQQPWQRATSSRPSISRVITPDETLGINNAGEIVGAYPEIVRRTAFSFTSGGFTLSTFPALLLHAYGINNRGEIVGAYLDGSGPERSLPWLSAF